MGWLSIVIYFGWIILLMRAVRGYQLSYERVIFLSMLPSFLLFVITLVMILFQGVFNLAPLLVGVGSYFIMLPALLSGAFFVIYGEEHSQKTPSKIMILGSVIGGVATFFLSMVYTYPLGGAFYLVILAMILGAVSILVERHWHCCRRLSLFLTLALLMISLAVYFSIRDEIRMDNDLVNTISINGVNNENN